jgi:general secretion pathway protein G
MNTRARRPAFGYADLIVILLLVAALAAFSLGAADKAREADNRIYCAKNLRSIGQGLLLYANENRGIFPCTRFDPRARKWNAYTGWRAPDPFDATKGGPIPDVNDVTAALFLLARTQDVTIREFVCPSGGARHWDFAPGAEEDRTKRRGLSAQDRANFPSPAFLSYGYGNPYPDQKGIEAGYRMSSMSGASQVLAADMGPEGKVFGTLAPDSPPEQMRTGNSANHEGAGQNVLYADGHVDFQQTPFAGEKGDNIYTIAGANDGSKPTSAMTMGSPRWRGDSVVLPPADVRGDETAEKLSQPAPEVKRMPQDAWLAAADLQISALRTALAAFEIDNGRYPTTAEGLRVLIQKPGGAPAWHGPYIKLANPTAMNDPWGHAYHYQFPGERNKREYDLISDGPDGKSGTADDVGVVNGK